MREPETYAPACPACGAYDAPLLGALGALTWFRCRDCGAEFAECEEAAQ